MFMGIKGKFPRNSAVPTLLISIIEMTILTNVANGSQ